MKTKFYISLSAATVVAVLVGVANRNSGEAQAQVTAGQQTNQDQEVNQVQTDRTNQTGRSAANRGRDRNQNAFKASELIGMNVRGREGNDDIGSINDLMVGKGGRVIYAAVSFGGFLGLGDKLFAVPFDAIEFVKTDDESYARIDVTQEKMENMEGFNQDNWPQQPNRQFSASSGQRRADRTGAGVNVDNFDESR